MKDLIDRQAVLDAFKKICAMCGNDKKYNGVMCGACYLEDGISIVEDAPSVQPEPLTDKEQRIFLAAMGREEKVCKEVDRNHVREPYEDSLMRVCKEIRRKVKGALWT